jgi:hypothetical protein
MVSLYEMALKTEEEEGVFVFRAPSVDGGKVLCRVIDADAYVVAANGELVNVMPPGREFWLLTKGEVVTEVPTQVSISVPLRL